MSYIEDLEEFDAELELRLKREDATVFGLFRYCVLTAEATYLSPPPLSQAVAAAALAGRGFGP